MTQDLIKYWAGLVNEDLASNVNIDENSDGRRYRSLIIGISEGEPPSSRYEKGLFHVEIAYGLDNDELMDDVKDKLGKYSDDSWIISLYFARTESQDNIRKMADKKIPGGTLDGRLVDFNDKMYKLSLWFSSANDVSRGESLIGQKGLKKDDFLKKLNSNLKGEKSCEVFRKEDGNWRFRDLDNGKVYGPSPSFLHWNRKSAYLAAEKAGYDNISILDDEEKN